MKQGMKNILIVLLIVVACFAMALSLNAQELKLGDNFEKRIGFVEDDIYLGRQVIAHTSVEIIISENDTTYCYVLKRYDEYVYFTMADILDVIDAIRLLDLRSQSGEYIGNNSFVLGKNEYLDRKDWYMLLNANISRKFYFIGNIDVFKYNMQQAALVLLDYKYGYKRK